MIRGGANSVNNISGNVIPILITAVGRFRGDGALPT